MALAQGVESSDLQEGLTKFSALIKEIKKQANANSCQFYVALDDRFRNSMAIADGACAARSRREEEDDALPSSTTTNEEIARNPRLPNGLRARVRTQTLSCADEHLRYIQFDLWAQQLSCYFGIDHLVPAKSYRDYKGHYLRINRLLRGLDIEVFDLTVVFDAQKQDYRQFYFEKDEHWNEEGNKIASVYLFKYLAEKLMINHRRDQFIRESLYKYYH